LNCGQDTAGSCYGGDDGGAYQFVHDNGIPDITCQMYNPYYSTHTAFWFDFNAFGPNRYQADDFDCNSMNTCKDCSSGSCVAVKSYNKMSVGEMDNVDGDDDIMKEIMTRGPVRFGSTIPIFSLYFTNAWSRQLRHRR
jgi:cathepsin X